MWVNAPNGLYMQEALDVLNRAEQEAQSHKHAHIDTEHLLLGLIDEGDCAAATTLRTLEVDLDKLRREIKSRIGSGDAEAPCDLALSSRCQLVIELAASEARQLGHAHVGTEHLLLGLVRE